jgi:hypothetical protein
MTISAAAWPTFWATLRRRARRRCARQNCSSGFCAGVPSRAGSFRAGSGDRADARVAMHGSYVRNALSATGSTSGPPHRDGSAIRRRGQATRSCAEQTFYSSVQLC